MGDSFLLTSPLTSASLSPDRQSLSAAAKSSSPSLAQSLADLGLRASATPHTASAMQVARPAAASHVMPRPRHRAAPGVTPRPRGAPSPTCAMVPS
jgi:hypothetical protein